ncbi:MAG TPA: hypothetical protein PLL26_05715 [Candidatus Dojkabacteria bacterium]|nr:hypothetical protein [Candidatus Dojkabacteria bacterium]
MYLFRIILRGLFDDNIEANYHTFYVIAKDTDEANFAVRRYLNEKDLSSSQDWFLESIELLAKIEQYTEYGVLFLPKKLQ